MSELAREPGAVTTVDVVDATGTKTASVDLPAEIFDTQVNIALIHQVVVGQLAAARQGTHSTMTRGEVAGGGRKPYRQKGTGRARQGSIRAPQFNGGGVVHGPTPHSHAQRTPKKMKAAALRGALSDRARDGRVHIVESFVQGEKPSTKAAKAVLANLSQRPRALVVLERSEELARLSLRNLEAIHVLYVDQLNTYDVLASDDVIFTRSAFDSLVARRPPRRSVERAQAPYGAGSAPRLESGEAPQGFAIKGNDSSMKYHQPDGQWYEQTVAEVWFDSAESAEKAGFVEAGSKASIEANEEAGA